MLRPAVGYSDAPQVESPMIRIASLLAPALMLAPPAIAGEPAAPAPSSAPSPAPSPAAVPPAPKSPDPAVLKRKRDALKPDEGTWSCEGKLQRPDGEVVHLFEMTNKPTADGAWLSTTKEWKQPTKRRQDGYLGWDVATSRYTHVEVTSEGTLVTCTSPDVAGVTTVWMCDGTSEGKSTTRRLTSTKKSEQERSTVGEVRLPDGTWRKLVESTCKKK